MSMEDKDLEESNPEVEDPPNQSATRKRTASNLEDDESAATTGIEQSGAIAQCGHADVCTFIIIEDSYFKADYLEKYPLAVFERVQNVRRNSGRKNRRGR